MAGRFFKDFGDFVDRFALPGREGLVEFDPDALGALQGDERAEAEALLLAQLQAGSGDPRVPRALADLGAKGALPALRQAAQRADQAGVAAALALWSLAQDPAAGPALVHALQEAADPAARLLAAAELHAFPGPQTEPALVAALDDEDELVRGQATSTLMAQSGLERYAAVPRSRLFRLTALVLNPLRAVRAPAIREIAALVAAARGEKGAAGLGLATAEQPESAALSRFAESVFTEPDPDDPQGPWQQDVDLASLDQLQGDERRWAEHLIYLLLGQGDVRGVRALVHLRDPAAVPALEEVARGKGEIAAAAGQAATSRRWTRPR